MVNRSTRRLMTPLILVGGLALTGCSTIQKYMPFGTGDLFASAPSSKKDAYGVTESKYFNPNHQGDMAKGLQLYHNQDYINALHEFYPLARGGNSQAQYYLGLIFAKGDGVPQDPILATKWLNKAATNGDADAQVAYADMLWSGIYLKQNRKSAVVWYEAAADQGNQRAQFFMGQLFAEGNQVQKNMTRSFNYIRDAAKGGYAAAQHRLALMYQYGLGTPAKLDESLYWFKRAVRSGDPSTEYDFSRFYRIGSSPYYDPVKALFWLRKSAEAGNAPANLELGALEKEVKVIQNSLTLFGQPVALVTRSQMRQVIRAQGGTKLDQQDDSWFDSYNSRKVWSPSDRLFVGYELNTGHLAILQYRLPQEDTPRGLTHIRHLLTQRYGKPDYDGSRVFEDNVYNRWKVKDTEIILSRGPGQNLFVTYQVQPAYKEMLQEQLQQGKARNPGEGVPVRVY